MTNATTPRQGPGRPAGVDSFDTRQRVITAACKCFAQYGYGPATNTLIAEMAGVTAGSVYYHFGTKRNLFAAVCGDVYGELIDGIERAVATPRPMAGLVRVCLREFIRINNETPDVARFMAAAPVDARRHPELFEVFVAQANRTSDILQAATVRSQRAGLIDPGVHPATLDVIQRAVVTGFAHTAVAYTAEEMEAAADLFVSRLLGEALPD